MSPKTLRYLPRVAACPLFAGLTATLLKLVFVRIRPMAMHHELNNVIGHYSVGWNYLANEEYIRQAAYDFQAFPSGHSATAMGFAVGLSWLFPRGRFLFFGIAVLACIQRVVAMAHWPSDVFAGAAIGVFIGVWITGTSMGDRIYSIFEQRNMNSEDGHAKELECDNDDVEDGVCDQAEVLSRN